MFAYETAIDPQTGEEYVKVPIKGLPVAENPVYNKGTAFTKRERDEFDLRGIYPDSVSSLELQKKKTYESFSQKPNPIEKYIYMLSLQDRNETLHYALILDHLTEMLPIVYTPTVGQACQQFSHLFRRPRGLYISANNIDKIDKILSNTAFENVRLIVATDGERILGLGDQGAGGMGIPIGKLSLYITAAGLHPSQCLPVMIDVGTNNEERLNDPLYIGLRQKRLTGDAYDRVIDAFVEAVKRKFPDALLQWEDIGKNNAFRVLARHRQNILSFNDDIQGTGSVATTVLLSAMRIKKERLRDQTIAILGQGQAGTGIGQQIITALMEDGLSREEAQHRIFGVDMYGLLVEGMAVNDEQKAVQKDRALIADWEVADENNISLLEVVKNSGATVLIGVSGQTDAFSDEVLAAIKNNTNVPLIMPLSNPTSKTECTPERGLKATDGSCLFATGSPFKPVDVNGQPQIISQCNNLYIFPGVGLGALVSGTSVVTDAMFMAASKKLSDMVTEEELQSKQLLPSLEKIRELSAQVALSVAVEARESGLCRQKSDEEFLAEIKKAMWQPEYLPLRYSGE
jgi:malate dehydrogenase (oxaloacetate-decarboxylating)